MESPSSSVCFLQFKQRNRSGLWGIGLFWKRVCRLVESPRPLLELEGDVYFYEPPKTPFPDPVFRKFDAQVTGFRN